MNEKSTSIRDVLYEPPGPKSRRLIIIVTGISLAALAVLVFLVIRQFYISGQLAPKYWTCSRAGLPGVFWAEAWRALCGWLPVQVL